MIRALTMLHTEDDKLALGKPACAPTKTTVGRPLRYVPCTTALPQTVASLAPTPSAHLHVRARQRPP